MRDNAPTPNRIFADGKEVIAMLRRVSSSIQIGYAALCIVLLGIVPSSLTAQAKNINVQDCPEFSSIPHTDTSSVSIRGGDQPHLQLTLGQSGTITALTTSEDGSVLLVGESTGVVVEWDLATKRQIGTLQDGSSPWPVDAIAANTKADLAIINNTCQLTVWGLKETTRIGYLPEQGVVDLRLSEDGSVLAILLKNELHVRSRVPGPGLFGPPRSIPVKQAGAVSISPDSKFIAMTTITGGAQVFTIPDLALVRTIDGFLDPETASPALDFEQSGQLLLRTFGNAVESFARSDWKDSLRCYINVEVPSSELQGSNHVELRTPGNLRIVHDGSQAMAIGTSGKCCDSFDRYSLTIVDLNTCKIRGRLRNQLNAPYPPPIGLIALSAKDKAIYYADGLAVDRIGEHEPERGVLKKAASPVTGATILDDSSWLVDSADDISIWQFDSVAVHRTVETPNDGRLVTFGTHGAHYVSAKDSGGSFYVSGINKDLDTGEFFLRGITGIGNPFGTKVQLFKQYVGRDGTLKARNSCEFGDGHRILGIEASENRDYIVSISSRWPKDGRSYHVHSVNTCRKVASGNISDSGQKNPVAVSNDGNTVAIAFGSRATLMRKGREIDIPTPSGSSVVSALAFSKNSLLLALGSEDGQAWIYKCDGTRPDLLYSGGGMRAPISTISFEDDGKGIYIGSEDGGVRYLEIARGGKIDPEIFDHFGTITTISSAPDGSSLLTGSADGTIALHLVGSSISVSFISFYDSGWDILFGNRFDSNSLEQEHGASWIVPDAPLEALPLEIFMRNYYEPRLLPRLLACKGADQTDPKACEKEFPPVPSLASLNRVQPVVEVTANWKDEAVGLAGVTVTVKSNRNLGMKNGKTSTEVYDLRVFRDGQLVGWVPKSGMEWQLAPPPSLPGTAIGEDERQHLREQNEAQDLALWQKKTHIDLDADGSKELVFTVQVPREKDLKKFTFTAYAFNVDRVKSETASATLMVDQPLQPRQGKAYLISLGVNRTESSPAWDLQYAANDARRMSEVVKEKLDGTKQFSEVVAVRLVSDAADKGETNELPAREAYLEGVLDLLAGREVDAKLRGEILKVAHLEKAQPEDLVLLAVSSHGYTDDQGVFHFVLQDVDQPQQVTDALNRETLNTNELSAWLRDVDGGEIVMVVDACESEATIQAEGFKPGPMGSRGLGQLAYDKGMRVLAASKAKESAIERGGSIKDGLLSYALVQNGLVDGLAAKDGKITMGEWLAYGEKRVPELFAEGETKGSIQVKDAPEASRDAYHGAKQTPERYQQPVLFDFRKNQSEVNLTFK
jgi:WD40 repeat protein